MVSSSLYNPKVSIVVPVFNRRELIQGTIKSLVNQSYRAWEALVIDDRSTDGTIDIVKNLSKDESRIKLVEKTGEIKSGQQTSRNLGIGLASGKYLIFLDSDDYLASFCLEQRVRIMEENPNLDFSVFPQLIFREWPGDSHILLNINTPEDDLDRFLKIGATVDVPWITSAPIWRTSSVKKHGLKWKEEVYGYQDVDFHVQALINRLIYKKYDVQPDCFWRMHDGEKVGKTLTNSYQMLSHEQMLINIYKSLKLEGLETGIRRSNIAGSLYHLCFLIYAQRKMYKQAMGLAAKMYEIGLIERKLKIAMNTYILIYIVLKMSDTLKYRVGLLIEKRICRGVESSEHSGFLVYKYRKEIKL